MILWFLEIALTSFFKEWAKYLASTKQFKHSPGDWPKPNVGENIAWTRGETPGPHEAANAVQAWYDEIKDYDWKTSDAKRPNAVIGHFTQVRKIYIWICK